ncbi:metal-dependent hydrolase [Tateyamaria omphalii]|uniref:metal-dependent hydrolase n=1 Tax=Tateyamaria omphalii TaxID=299262 RepID=UPI001C991F74|nr:metal-dependent hydrolase [Tateyamaria omphalii]MBY5931795.1 metal-dependent hydrolase [Tateyamaria omphalii]
MIIGHAPAGYLLASALDRSFFRDPVIFWSIVVGAVVPDLDMLWFFFVDRGTTHHHTYLTHDPTLWSVLLFIGFVLTSRLLIGLGMGGLLHMALDSIAGAVTWGWGAYSVSGPLVVVPPTQDHWLMSFLLHWLILVEIVLWICAAVLFWRRRSLPVIE